MEEIKALKRNHVTILNGLFKNERCNYKLFSVYLTDYLFVYEESFEQPIWYRMGSDRKSENCNKGQKYETCY